MKYLKILYIDILLLLSSPIYADIEVISQPIAELVGIVWYLGEADEWSMLEHKYQKEVDKYFSKYKKHDAISNVKFLRENGLEIGYNAVSKLADVLTIDHNNNVTITSDTALLLLAKQDGRWTIELLNRTANLLNDFSRETKFMKFYNRLLPVYQKYIDKVDSVADEINVNWFECFYDEVFPDIKICVSPAFGKNNFSPSNDNILHLGCTYPVDEALDKVRRQYEPILVHEISHWFSYSIIDSFVVKSDVVFNAMRRIYPYVENEMALIGYGDGCVECLTQEWLNDLFCIIYLMDNVSKPVLSLADMALNTSLAKGYYWMDWAVDYMSNFRMLRNVYPNIQDFMPQLNDFICGISNDIESIVEPPYVVATFPSGNEVSTDISEIRIYFSHPMMMGLVAIGDPLSENVESIDFDYDNEMIDWDNVEDDYWENNRTLVVHINRKLKSNTQYGILISKLLSRTNGVHLKSDEEILFKTK